MNISTYRCFPFFAVADGGMSAFPGLELGGLGGSREGDDVADVGHASAEEAESKGTGTLIRPDGFRCCYGGVDTAPVAIFLGSDGIDDSFGEEENLYDFYVQLAKGFVRDGYEAAVSDLERTLPVLSRRGSQDDMSVSGIYDDRIQSLLPQLVHWQIGRMQVKVDDLSNNLAQSWANIVKGAFSPTDRIMAYNDLARYCKEKANQQERINKLRQELVINPPNRNYSGYFGEE